MANKEVKFHESFLPSFKCWPSRTAIGGQVTGRADAKAARSGLPDFLASVVFCILLNGKLWSELACGQVLESAKACAEVLGGQAALAEELAQKISGREVSLARVAVQAAGNQVAVRIAPTRRLRHDVIQAVGPAGRPAQTVKARAPFAGVDGLAQAAGSQEIRFFNVGPIA